MARPTARNRILKCTNNTDCSGTTIAKAATAVCFFLAAMQRYHFLMAARSTTEPTLPNLPSVNETATVFLARTIFGSI